MYKEVMCWGITNVLPSASDNIKDIRENLLSYMKIIGQ